MTTVPFLQRRDLVPAALAFNLSHQLPQYIKYGKMAYNYLKKRYTRYKPALRRTLGRYRRSPYRKPYKKGRRKIFKKFKNAGRRTYGSRTIILRRNLHDRITFHQDAHGDFTPQRVDLNIPGYWLPADWEMDPLQLSRFNNAGSKRLISVHIYYRNIRYTEESGNHSSVVTAPQDNTFFTYAAPNAETIPTQPSHKILSGGLQKKLRRGSAGYHQVLKQNCYANASTSEEMQTLLLKTWSEATHEFDFYNKTGTQTTTTPRLNIEHYVMPEVNSCQTTGVTGCLKFEMIVATKWRLYTSKP